MKELQEVSSKTTKYVKEVEENIKEFKQKCQDYKDNRIKTLFKLNKD